MGAAKTRKKRQRRSRAFLLRQNETLDIDVKGKASIRVNFPPHVRIRVVKRD